MNIMSMLIYNNKFDWNIQDQYVLSEFWKPWCIMALYGG